MQIVGEWLLCDDTVTRPIVRAQVLVVPQSRALLPEGAQVEIVILPPEVSPELQAEFDAWERTSDEAWAQIDQWEQEERS